MAQVRIYLSQNFPTCFYHCVVVMKYVELSNYPDFPTIWKTLDLSYKDTYK